MAAVTYLIRMLPLVLMRRKIENKYIKSFLLYVPYAVLAAMVLPDIFYSTESVASALAGLVVAVIMAFWKENLTIVALSACAAVFIAERIIPLLGM